MHNGQNHSLIFKSPCNFHLLELQFKSITNNPILRHIDGINEPPMYYNVIPTILLAIIVVEHLYAP